MPYSNPQTELLSQLIHQFIVAPVFPDGQSPEELEITQKIVTSLNELKDRNSALSQISSNGDTLFVSMVIWSDELRPVEDKENKKLEAILRVFDTHLSAEDWLWFMTSVTEANFEILLGLGPRTLIIQTLVQFTSKITKNPRFKKDLQILSKVLLSAQFRHTNLAVATEQVNNIHGAVILDSIFKSSDLKEITTLIDAQKTEPQFILGSLLELESLKQFARHLNQINSDYAHTFFQTTFNELVFNKMNLLSFSIFFKKGELFRFLLEECKVNPRYTGDFMSDEDCISFLLLKCCEDQAYYPFFISILPWLEIYVQTYNQGKNPDRWLRHPYQPDANFIPLVFMLSHKGERFVQFLMKHIAADWLKLLSTRNVKTFYPIWIPYIEPYYSVTPNYLTDYVDATRHLKKPMDAFKLIYALVQSLSIKNDPIATNENQKKIFVAFAKQVLDNSLRYPDLLQIGREYIKHPIEAKESSFTQLQQLAKDENFLTNIKSIVKKLPKSNLISLLIIHGILSILDKQSQDTNLQDLLEMKQPGKDLTDLVSFIESLVKSCAYPEYLYEMAVHYGFDKLESKLWSDLKQMKTLSGNSTVSMKARLQGKLNQTREKKKENFYPIESKKDALPESAEHALEMKINWLQFSLDGTSSTPLKQEKIDADMKTIAQELSAYLGPKGQQFSKDYKALQLLRMKYVEHNGNLELKVCSPKNPKKKKKPKNKSSLSVPVLIEAKISNTTLPSTEKKSIVPQLEVEPVVSSEPVADKKMPSIPLAKAKSPKKKNKTVASVAKRKDDEVKPEKDAIKRFPPESKVESVEFLVSNLNDDLVKLDSRTRTIPGLSAPMDPAEKLREVAVENVEPLVSTLKDDLVKLESVDNCPKTRTTPTFFPKLKYSGSENPTILGLVHPCFASLNVYCYQIDKEEAFIEYIQLYFKQMILDLFQFINQLSFQQTYAIHEPIELSSMESIKQTIHHLILKIQTQFPQYLTSAPIEKSYDPWLNKEHLQSKRLNHLLKIMEWTGDKDLNRLDKFAQMYPQVHAKCKDNFSKDREIFHLWNQFITAHLNALNRIQEMSETIQSPASPALQELVDTLHYLFLPTRFRTQEEHELHHQFARFPVFLDGMLGYAHLGACIETLEVGSQVCGYVENFPRSDTDFYTEVHLNNRDDFERLKQYVSRCVVANCTAEDSAKLAYESENSILWVLTLGGRKIDWIIALDPFEQSMDARMMPFGMLSFNFLTGTVFNPANGFDSKHLMRLCHYQSGRLIDILPQELDALVNDASKISFVLRMLAKSHQVYPMATHDNLALATLLKRTAIGLVFEFQEVGKGNAFTTLFGKKSLLLAGLHHRLFANNLVFIFGLCIEQDLPFLMHVQAIFQQKEQEEPGWSRPCMLQFTSVDYIALMLHGFLRKSVHVDKNPDHAIQARVRELACRCLKQPWADQAFHLVLQMESYLTGKSNHPTKVCDIFNLKEFYAPKADLNVAPGSRIQVSNTCYSLFGSVYPQGFMEVSSTIQPVNL